MSAESIAPLHPEHEFNYRAAVIETFRSALHAGSLAGADGAVSGTAGWRAQGASVRVWLQFRDERVVAARFTAYGCPHFIAAAECLCAWAEGRTRAELQTWNWRAVASYLEVPAVKRARLLVLEDALRRAAGAAGQNR